MSGVPGQLTDEGVRNRDMWQCTAQIQPRVFQTPKGPITRPETPRRCPVMGSEMVVRDGHTFCPHHAREGAASAYVGKEGRYGA